MNDQTTEKDCQKISRVTAAAIGVLAFLLMWVWLEWGLFLSLILGTVLYFMAEGVLKNILCNPDEEANVEVVATDPPSEALVEPDHAKADEPAIAAADQQSPRLLSAPQDGSADDLKVIKGIGPGLEKSLNTMGIYHLEQMASWSDQDVAWIDENLVRFKGRASRDDWVGQARDLIAASGNES